MKKAASKAASPKSSKKKTPKIKDLKPSKNPRGGTSDHNPKSGGKNSDY